MAGSRSSFDGDRDIWQSRRHSVVDPRSGGGRSYAGRERNGDIDSTDQPSVRGYEIWQESDHLRNLSHDGHVDSHVGQFDRTGNQYW